MLELREPYGDEPEGYQRCMRLAIALHKEADFSQDKALRLALQIMQVRTDVMERRILGS
jgi:hypothetical protein